MLKTKSANFYKVQSGQTLQEIADYFSVSEFLLAKTNGLKSEVSAGMILAIPKECGNAYIVREGDTKSLLCGSEEAFLQKNGTDIFYLGMRVIL